MKETLTQGGLGVSFTKGTQRLKQVTCYDQSLPAGGSRPEQGSDLPRAGLLLRSFLNTPSGIQLPLLEQVPGKGQEPQYRISFDSNK